MQDTKYTLSYVPDVHCIASGLTAQDPRVERNGIPPSNTYCVECSIILVGCRMRFDCCV